MTVYQIISIWIITSISMYFYLLPDKSRFEGKHFFVTLIGGPILIFIALLDCIFNFLKTR